jgi:hypothetical protein
MKRWRCRPEESARIALRTQQIIAAETGVTAPSISRRRMRHRIADE